MDKKFSCQSIALSLCSGGLDEGVNVLVFKFLKIALLDKIRSICLHSFQIQIISYM